MQLPSQLDDKKLEEARASAGDGAARLESAAEQLAVLQRSIVAPKIEELARLERMAQDLERELNQLDANPRITKWHVEADELLDKLDNLEVDNEAADELRDEMRKAGWGGDVARSNWGWGRTAGGPYAAPSHYRMLLSRLAESLRRRMQEYLLGQTQATGDEPIPPQYQDLVDRYYQVLALEGKARVPPPPTPGGNK